MNDDEIYPLRHERSSRVPPPTTLSTQSILSTLSTLREIYVEKFPRQTWELFKTIAHSQGKTTRNLLIKVISDYNEAHANEVYSQVNIISINVEGDVNIYQTIINEEITQICKAIKDGKTRNAPKPYINDLRDNLLKTLKQNPNVSPELAEEVKATLTLLREARK